MINNLCSNQEKILKTIVKKDEEIYLLSASYKDFKMK